MQHRIVSHWKKATTTWCIGNLCGGGESGQHPVTYSNHTIITPLFFISSPWKWQVDLIIIWETHVIVNIKHILLNLVWPKLESQRPVSVNQIQGRGKVIIRFWLSGFEESRQSFEAQILFKDVLLEQHLLPTWFTERNWDTLWFLMMSLKWSAQACVFTLFRDEQKQV